MTKLIVELGGDVNFETLFTIKTSGFGVGKGNQVSISSTFYEQLLHAQAPKA